MIIDAELKACLAQGQRHRAECPLTALACQICAYGLVLQHTYEALELTIKAQTSLRAEVVPREPTSRRNIHAEKHVLHEDCADPAECDCECRTCKRAWEVAGRPRPRTAISQFEALDSALLKFCLDLECKAKDYPQYGTPDSSAERDAGYRAGVLEVIGSLRRLLVPWREAHAKAVRP